MNLLLEVRSLTPRQLDYAIAKARGRDWAAQQVIDNPDGYYYRPTSDWHYCGPLLDQMQHVDTTFVDLDLMTADLSVRIAVCQLWLTHYCPHGVRIPFTFLTEQQVKEYAESLDWT